MITFDFKCEVRDRSGDDLDQSEGVMSPDLDDDGEPNVRKKRKKKKKLLGNHDISIPSFIFTRILIFQN